MITGNQAFIKAPHDDAGTNFLAAYLLGIGEAEQTIEPLDASVLANLVYRRYHPADLIEPGQHELRFFFDPQDNESIFRDAATFRPGNVTTLLLSFQLSPLGQTAATLQGRGFFVGRIYPELLNDQLAEARATWQFDGWDIAGTAPGPVFTPEVPTP